MLEATAQHFRSHRPAGSSCELKVPQHGLAQRLRVPVRRMRKPRPDSRCNLLGAHPARMQLRKRGFRARSKPTHVVAFELYTNCCAVSLQHKADKCHGLAGSVQPVLFGMQLQPQAVAVLLDAQAHIFEQRAAFCVHDDVVAISNEGANAKVGADQMIDWSHHRVGPDLRREIANGQAVARSS